ncbi:enoyl-CoA hydratase/isomerase family protein [Halorubrum sp. JWXQ-INN 858]|uniref:enoyl-CoA hydratase/isomerase family protein n=1 Tax=Halorubrum sp. JWXQ-INN 858 TaxID=2690782 RepID=UPI0013572AA9|nr:enoyl-CoA hydratase-related protein [Halorubrum sp. JWXQ-INN 858]MWV64316.1 enoyl-CoA hydratase/isomerase family protein [Halorubrum sp. JWXQ-INN 858]
MEWDTVTLEIDEDVATLTIDRPERLNTLTVDALEAVAEALDAAAAAEVRALVLTGAGEDAFIAGADVSYMTDLTTPEAQAYAELGHRVVDAIETFPAPAIAAINGYAFGGGCEFALACDLRVAAEGAVLGQTEIDIGLVPGWGGTQRLSRLVGDETARRLVFFGERLDASEAAAIGLVGEVVPDAELDDHVARMAAELAAKPAFALRGAKEALNAVHDGSQTVGLDYEKRLWSGLFGTHDQREGMAAFLEKREPAFE